MKANKLIESQVINFKNNRRMQPKQIFENINFVNNASAKVSRTVSFLCCLLFSFTFHLL